MKNHTSRKFVLAAITALALVASALQAQAQNATVTFDFTQLTKNVATDTITGSDGVTTLTLTVNSGVLVADSPSFVDPELEVAVKNSGRMLTFNFSKNVTLENYEIGNHGSSWEGDENFQLSNGIVTVTEPIPANITNTTYDFTNKLSVLSTNNMTLTFINPDNGYDGISWLKMTVTAVPEPASYALLLGFGAFLFIMIRHRIRR